MKHLTRIITRIFVVAVVAAAVGLAAAVSTADALNPPQRTATGLVNTLYADLDRTWSSLFASWRRPYKRPAVVWYNAGRVVRVPANCDSFDGRKDGLMSINQSYRSWNDGANSFYCPSNHALYLDYRLFHFMVTAKDDGAAAALLAHEYAHAITQLLGGRKGFASRSIELEADCLGGMSLRYSRLINAQDLQWARYFLHQWGDNRPAAQATHGSSQQRVAWFDYGYKYYDGLKCFNASFR